MPTLEFKGKQFVYSHHLSVPFRELQIQPDKSFPAEGMAPSIEDNLIIHGDNLEALKALLPTHAGKVDCIFIDPPYNTGNEGWCYNDNVRSPLMKEWLKKSANPVDKEDLERHDKWLCMMWPRINLLRELLSEDGVIFVTIDDNEVHRLIGLMDEVFGDDNFITTIVWNKRVSPANDAEYFSTDHDHIIVFAKNKTEWRPNKLLRTEEQEVYFSNPDNDPRGPWNSGTYTCNKSSAERPNLYYPIKNPNTGKEIWPKKTAVWRYSQQRHQKNVEEDLVWWGKNGDASRPRFKQFVRNEGIVPRSVWSYSETGSTQEARLEIRKILNESPFQTPKPRRLLDRILEVATDENSIILDSFAGSGTTAHAVLGANKKDNGNRRFILVECENYADNLTAERVRRIIKGFPYNGTQHEELYRENITWSTFKKKQKKILELVHSIEIMYGREYDKIKKQIKDGVLTVTGERKIEKEVPGLGGSFTFCALGDPINIESLLTGEALPSFDALARYVFYTATGHSLAKESVPAKDGFIGETDLFQVHLFYMPDKIWLRSNEAALNAERVEAIEKGNNKRKRAVVFAVAKFMSQKELTAKRIEFCQLPYAVHRILGD